MQQVRTSRGLIFILILKVWSAAWLDPSDLITVKITGTQWNNHRPTFLKNHWETSSLYMTGDRWHQWLVMQKNYPSAGWWDQTGPPAWFNLLCGVPAVRAAAFEMCRWDVHSGRARRSAPRTCPVLGLAAKQEANCAPCTVHFGG